MDKVTFVSKTLENFLNINFNFALPCISFETKARKLFCLLQKLNTVEVLSFWLDCRQASASVGVEVKNNVLSSSVNSYKMHSVLELNCCMAIK